MEVWNPSTVLFDLSDRLFVPNRMENLNVKVSYVLSKNKLKVLNGHD